MPPRRGVLLSVFYSGDDRAAVMKFYDVDSGEVFLVKDQTDHKPYLLTNAPEEKIPEALSEFASRIHSISRVRKYDVLRDREVELTKVEAKDPLAIGGSPKNMRDVLAKLGYDVWEARIKYYDCFVFDRNLIPGCLYEIDDSGDLRRISVEAELEGELLNSDSEVREVLLSMIPLFDEPSPSMPNACTRYRGLIPVR
jgi:DNA polymerase I